MLWNNVFHKHRFKNSHKMLANWAQQHRTRIIYHDGVTFVLEMQSSVNMKKSINGIHHIYQVWEEKIISAECRGKADKIQYSFLLKIVKTRNKKLSWSDKGQWLKSNMNISKDFFIRSEKGQRYLLLSLWFNIYWKF